MTRMLSPRSALPLTLAAALSALVAGCSKPEAAPPVAKVTVTTNRPRVGPGAPLEMHFKFDVLPGAAIKDNYRVFVHVLNADRQPFWVDDDHDPPVPTSQWKPGQVIEYTRFRFVPESTAAGEASIEVGLYKDNDRLSLQGPENSAREVRGQEYKVATLQIQPESENVFRIFKSGWHPEEFSPTDPTLSWKWTKKSAVISLRNPKGDATLYLQFDGRPDLFPGAPQQVAVTLDGRPVESFAIDSDKLKLLRIPLTAAKLGDAEMVELRLDVDRTFIPANLPQGGKDTRELGFRVYHAFIEGPISPR
jgi:hypothetical protein